LLDILKIALVFGVILVFLRLKWNIGYVMLMASCMLFLLYLVPVPAIFSTIKTTATDAVTIKLFFALTLIRVLEMVLREKQALAKMTEASRRLLRKKKAVIISMPMLIGLLPSLGGAYFSAPMVDESTKGLGMSPEEKGFINYWFRHPWEFILPLYPGVLLASAIAGIELRSLIFANMAYAVLIVITGFLFGLRDIYSRQSAVSSRQPAENQTKDLRLLLSFLPVAGILIMVMALHIELHYAIGITVLGLFMFYRLSIKEIARALRHGFAIDVLVMIFGTMLFKFAMENSGAVMHLNRYFTESGIPVLSVLFMLPFITGLLTGLTVGFIGSTFPLIISLTGGPHLNQLTFAFASGFAGVLLSPVHLCLVLTREYFKADMWGIYKKTIPSIAIVMAAAFIEYLLLK
jgi:integral membrane protein (TIGR00529 family)